MDTEKEMEDDVIQQGKSFGGQCAVNQEEPHEVQRTPETPKRQIPDINTWAEPLFSDVKFIIRGNPLIDGYEVIVVFAPPGIPSPNQLALSCYCKQEIRGLYTLISCFLF